MDMSAVIDNDDKISNELKSQKSQDFVKTYEV